MMVKLSTQQVGKCGELLVQYMLLKQGVESAPLTTDPGIDLVAFRDIKRKAVTIQVKTCNPRIERSDPEGSKWLEWWVSDKCLAVANYVAAVDLNRPKCWLFSTEEFKRRGATSGEGYRLWWYIPGHEYGRTRKTEEKFKEYEMYTAMPKVFGPE